MSGHLLRTSLIRAACARPCPAALSRSSRMEMPQAVPAFDALHYENNFPDL